MSDQGWRILTGDCRDVMATLPDNSVDSVVCDPPYELGFMGKKWDSSGIAYDVAVWSEALRVLKPGGHLIAFGSSRTYHRLACAIEDAGFQIRDQIQWLYGTGFPKSLNVEKQTGNPAHAGMGTALKPAHEPAVLARKPLIGTVAQNVTTHGTGGLHIGACRVGTDGGRTNHTKSSGDHRDRWDGNISTGQATMHGGRWPANVCHDDSADITHALGDAARFFYSPKAAKAEREAGLDSLDIAPARGSMNTVNGMGERFDGAATPKRRNVHPTVKPISVMKWCLRMVTPPGGLVLDPFTGSGSTGCAAVLEGFHFIGIDISEQYAEIARLRVAHHAG